MLRDKTVDGIDLTIDDEARSQGVLVAFARRTGGVSRPPYDSLNLAASVGDDPKDVDENRRRIASALGSQVSDLVLAKQVHGCGVMAATASSSGTIGEADVLVTREPGKIIGILTADCVPVVLHGPSSVAIAHAGWRGLVGGAIEAAIEHVGPVTKAWVGPSIHACCYEVGPEVIDAFRARGLPVADDSHVDPGRAAVVALHRAGVEKVESTTDCTACDDGYFSFRRDGLTGRQGAFAGLLAP
jgi:polyphenol oxidase